jgi:hypothetical protein
MPYAQQLRHQDRTVFRRLARSCSRPFASQHERPVWRRPCDLSHERTDRSQVVSVGVPAIRVRISPRAVCASWTFLRPPVATATARRTHARSCTTRGRNDLAEGDDAASRWHRCCFASWVSGAREVADTVQQFSTTPTTDAGDTMRIALLAVMASTMMATSARQGVAQQRPPSEGEIRDRVRSAESNRDARSSDRDGRWDWDRGRDRDRDRDRNRDRDRDRDRERDRERARAEAEARRYDRGNGWGRDYDRRAFERDQRDFDKRARRWNRFQWDAFRDCERDLWRRSRWDRNDSRLEVLWERARIREYCERRVSRW